MSSPSGCRGVQLPSLWTGFPEAVTWEEQLSIACPVENSSDAQHSRFRICACLNTQVLIVSFPMVECVVTGRVMGGRVVFVGSLTGTPSTTHTVCG